MRHFFSLTLLFFLTHYCYCSEVDVTSYISKTTNDKATKKLSKQIPEKNTQLKIERSPKKMNQNQQHIADPKALTSGHTDSNIQQQTNLDEKISVILSKKQAKNYMKQNPIYVKRKK
jgi:hypothetical protein